MKKCSICNKEKSLDKYHSRLKYSRRKNEEYIYYLPYCKTCNKNKAMQWCKDNPEKRRISKSKYDKKPHVQEMKRRWNRKNIDSGRFLKWQQENKHKIKEYHQQRYIHKKHEISEDQWIQCKNYFNDSCAYCGIHISEHYVRYKSKMILTDLHKEHVDHDGANDLSNCVPACKLCNSSKYNFVLEDWYNENNLNFTMERLTKIHKWLNIDYLMYI